MDKTRKNKSFWVLIVIAIYLVAMFLAGQTLSLFDYDLTVNLGLQESEDEIGEVGIAFAKGFGFGDTVIYIPLLIGGIIGLLKNKRWGKYSMFAALTITVYWPLVHFYAIFIGRTSMNLQSDKYIAYPIILSLIIIYGLWGMYYLYKYETIEKNEI
jgi:hypothetical protein